MKYEHLKANDVFTYSLPHFNKHVCLLHDVSELEINWYPIYSKLHREFIDEREGKEGK